MPIRHGLPPAAGGDTIPTADQATADQATADRATPPGHRTVLADEHGWPFYVFDQIEYLANRLAAPRLPTTVLDPATPLPTLDNLDNNAHNETGDSGGGTGGGLTVPYALAVIGPKNAPAELVDRAWRYLITAARARRGQWNLYALGLARLGLHKTADQLTPRKPPSVKQQVQQLIAAEFLLELHRSEPDETGRQVYAFELDKPYIYARLRDHCVYAATTRRWTRQARDKANLNLDDFAYLHELAPAGNTISRLWHIPGRLDAYTVLARLVTQSATARDGQRLTRGDAALIALTHLIGYPLAQAAAMLGLPTPTARMRQYRARKLIARLLDHQPDSATADSGDTATRAGAQPSAAARDPD